MLRLRLIPLLIFVLLTSAAFGQSDLSSSMKIINAQERQQAVIEKFAVLAKAGDVNGMVALFVPAGRKAIGDEVISRTFSQKAVPLFANYRQMHGHRTIEPRDMPDGSVGYRHYAYFVDEEGAKVPFEIIVIESDSVFYVATFSARGCVKGRHPGC